MAELNTTYTQNGIEAEKFVEDMTSSAYQTYQENGAAAERYMEETARSASLIYQE